MDPLTMGLIAGGSNLLGSIFSSSTAKSNSQDQIAAQQAMQQQSQTFNAEEAAKSRDFNADQAQLGRDYSTQMSNTAYQRASSDMKAAGLNPMMMAGGSMNASTPSPSVASGPAASTGTPTVPLSQNRGAFSALGDNIRAGIDAAVSAKTMDKMTDEIANLKKTGLQTEANTVATQATVPLTNATTSLRSQETATERQKTLGSAEDVTQKRLDRARQEWDAIKYLDLSNIPDYARKTGNIGSWGGQKLSDVVAPIVSSAVGYKNLFKDRFHY